MTAMYGALWRLMPGPVWLRIILFILFFVIVLGVLIVIVFPWLNGFVGVGVDDVTVGDR